MPSEQEGQWIEGGIIIIIIIIIKQFLKHWKSINNRDTYFPTSWTKNEKGVMDNTFTTEREEAWAITSQQEGPLMGEAWVIASQREGSEMGRGYMGIDFPIYCPSQRVQGLGCLGK